MTKISLPKKRILKILEKYESGYDIYKLCSEHNISVETLYDWHRRYDTNSLLILNELRALRKENKRLKEYCGTLSRDFTQVKELFETSRA